jgi:O-acetyl-ADP-ribose deacetylase (regulator of RNase III)
MRVIALQGDVLDEVVDVLICTANPTLAMSGGVNGALLARGGSDVQAELKRFLTSLGKRWADPGTIVRTGPGPLRVKHILHAVRVNAFYESSTTLVKGLPRKALLQAAELGARSVATPALATGCGPLSMAEFAEAAACAATAGCEGIEDFRIVLRDAEDAREVGEVLMRAGAVVAEQTKP